jgi:hypothetical protein
MNFNHPLTTMSSARRWHWIGVMAVIFGLFGCTRSVVDDDNRIVGARMVIPDRRMPIQDSLDVLRDDTVDYKFIIPRYDGKVTLNFTIGDAFSDTNSLVGDIQVLSDFGNRMGPATPIELNKVQYKVSFDAKANQRYVVAIKARSGAGPYVIRYKQKKKVLDPCANVSCGANQTCNAGVCIDNDQPKLDVWSGCGGCSKGHYCSKKRKKCLRNLCYKVRCPSGKRCVGGKCRTIAPRGCRPRCKKGFKCSRARRCIPTKPQPNACGGRCKRPYKCDVGTNKCVVSPTAHGRILYVTPKGASSIITINRGKVHLLKKGMTGNVKKGGYRLKLLKVFGLQCKAIVYTSAANLTKGMGVRIKRR